LPVLLIGVRETKANVFAAFQQRRDGLAKFQCYVKRSCGNLCGLQEAMERW